MKKSLLWLAFLSLALVLTGCPDKPEPTPQPEPEPQPTKYSVSVSPTSLLFEGEGGTLKVAITTDAPSIQISGGASWLKADLSGKELALTAEANLVAEERSASLTVTVEGGSANLEVKQKAGSPYPGYTVYTAATYEYSGVGMYSLIKPVTEDYGGMAYLVASSEDEGTILTINFFTENFACADDVVLPEGVYSVGKDDYNNLTLYAEPGTFAAGAVMVDEDEVITFGSIFYDELAGSVAPVTDGSFEIKDNGDGTYLIKFDLKDDKGNDLKYVFEGEVEFNIEDATYPSEGGERPDPSENVTEATCAFLGCKYSEESCTLQLSLVSGEDGDISTTFEFNIPVTDFESLDDISGEYYSDQENTFAPGTCNLGVLEDYGFFQFPAHSYIMFDFGDYHIPDGFVSLTLEKLENGNYKIGGAMANADFTEFYMFMDIELPIDIYDANAEYDDDDEDYDD